MSAFAYVRPDQVFTGTVSGGTIDATHARAWLVDGDPSTPARSTDGAADWTISGAAVTVGLIALVNHNLDGAKTINITGDVTTTLTAPAVPPHGIRKNPVRILEAPVSNVDDLTIGITGNTDPVTIGECIAGPVSYLPQTLRGATGFEVDVFAQPRDRRRAWSKRRDHGMEARTWSGTGLLTYAELESLIALQQATMGGTKPILIVPDVTVNDAWFVDMDRLRWSPSNDSPRHVEAEIGFTEAPRVRWL